MNSCKKLFRKPISFLLWTVIILLTSACKADENADKITLFPLDNYDQTISHWINPADPRYDTRLFSATIQQQRFDTFFNHYYGRKSPWNPTYLNTLLHHTHDNIKQIELSIIHDFTNVNKPENEIAYGENFHPYTLQWIEAIQANMHLAQFDDFRYQPQQRGIAVENSPLRALPTDDPSFYNHKLAGEGYPFDNLQMSAVWAGTPVYILGETDDYAWYLIVTPDCIAWVKSKHIAHVDTLFVNTWQSAAKKQLMAITHTQSSILDSQNRLLLSAYIGAVFPVDESGQGNILVPVQDANQNAVIQHGHVDTQHVTAMPLAATPHNIATIMSTLIGRPYGWGNLYFYNDCSAELKNLFTPFGIWLPRHSSDQVSVGKMEDVSTLSADQRINYLMENGRPFMTLVYIGGHVILYAGKYPNPHSTAHEPIAMTYQNLWGLSPHPAIVRHVIGRAVLFPMLLQYPEDTSLNSLANKKYFQIAYLDETPHYLINEEVINLRSLMYSMNELN